MLMVTALASHLAAAEEALAPTIAPAYVIAIVAAAVFFVLGYVVFSYKNVALRQRAHGTSAGPHGPGGQHEAPIDEFGHTEQH